ncbi:MAG: T9SS type A sorting domain-containing protein [Bacteroidetes bacterium]|nr:T9SS type A sorting domain-containing protein [Bacteroidota bacterium]
MKKNITTLCLLISLSFSSKAQNIVGNPGFETNSGLINGNNGCYSALVQQWLPVAPWGVPWVTNICLACGAGLTPCHSCVESPDLGKEFVPLTNTWNYYSTTLENEYIVQDFTNPMQADHEYFIQFRARPNAGSSANGGIHFNMKHPKQCTNNYIKGYGFTAPNVAIPASMYDSQWHKISAYWVAKDNFKSLTLGYIHQTGGDNFGVNWDDFRIYDVGSSTCPQYNFIQNVNFDDVDGILYKSSVLTAAGSSFDPSQPTGEVHVENTSDVTFISEQQVALMPGFSADAGSTFSAFIAPCNDYACPIASAYIGAENEYCVQAGQQVPLGGNGGNSDETCQWTATGLGGIDMSSYLSNTNGPNSTLTIPTGSGFIQVTETVHNTCSNTDATDQAIIYYDDAPVSNPAISVSPSSINSNSTNFMLSIQGNSHTENVYITLNDNSNNIVATWDIDDFQTLCNLNYQYAFNGAYPSFDPCKNYTFNIMSKNICSNNLSSTPAQVTWSYPPSAGIGIVRGDLYVCKWGVPMKIYANFIDYYDITVYDRYGTKVYYGSGNPGGANPFPVYDGQCNQGCSNYGVTDGTYSFILTLQNTCGYQQTFDNFVTVTSGCRVADSSNINPAGWAVLTPSDSSQTNSRLSHDSLSTASFPVKSNVTSAGIKIFPNPSSGELSISFSSSKSFAMQVTISDGTSRVLLQQNYSINPGSNSYKIDISSLDSGAYTLQIDNERFKIILVK